jgi:tetratricopeptide (TPR) repeat protein
MSGTAAEHKALLEQCLQTIETSSQTETILPAISAACRLLYYLGGAEGSERFLTNVTRRAYSVSDLAVRLALDPSIVTVAWAAKQLSRYQDFRASIARLSVDCEQSGIESAMRFGLENVRGCVETSSGDYEGALQAYRTAYRIAQRIGDDERSAVSATNIALCLGRLGAYTEQRDWADKALRAAPRSMPAWRLIRPRFYLAWAAAMAGEVHQALGVLPEALGNTMDPPIWAIQSSGVLRADILQLCGEREKALRLAREVISSTGFAPLSGECPGTVARWVALASPEDPQARKVITSLIADIERWDVVDQAEVLAAFTWLEAQSGRRAEEEMERLSQCLTKLPAPVGHQLQRLGVLAG